MITRRAALALCCVALALLLTACFRDASEVIEAPPVAQEVASATAMESATSQPTVTDEPLEVLATEAPPDHFALTATALLARLTQAADPEPVAGATARSEAAAPATEVVLPTAIPLVRATVPPGEDCIHEIRGGETLYMLSLAYGSTVDLIAEASGINDVNRITVGQRITIPGCGSAGFAPPPTSAPTATADAIATLPPAATSQTEVVDSGAGDAHDALVQQAQDTILGNAQAELAANIDTQSAAATPSRRYTVQQDDTLLGIALRFGTTLQALASLNNITDVDNVATGDVLWVP